MLNVLNLHSQPAPISPKPDYTNNVGATPSAIPPSSAYGVPRGGRITSQTFSRQPINNPFSRRPKSSFRQQSQRFVQNTRQVPVGAIGRFTG